MKKMKPQAARKRTPRSPQLQAKAPEPCLAAFLAYIDGCLPADVAESHAEIVAIADRVIATAPGSLAGNIDPKGPCELLLDRLSGDVRDDDYNRGMATAVEAMRDDEQCVDGKYAYAALMSSVGDAMLVGAALMYRLLNGGAR